METFTELQLQLCLDSRATSYGKYSVPRYVSWVFSRCQPLNRRTVSCPIILICTAWAFRISSLSSSNLWNNDHNTSLKLESFFHLQLRSPVIMQMPVEYISYGIYALWALDTWYRKILVTHYNTCPEDFTKEIEKWKGKWKGAQLFMVVVYFQEKSLCHTDQYISHVNWEPAVNFILDISWAIVFQFYYWLRTLLILSTCLVDVLLR